MLVGTLVCPLADRLEHVLLNLDSVIAGCRVVESTKDVIDDFIDRYSGILPSVKNTRDNILQNGSSNSARAGVQDIGEVILG